jgi:hypothetical protein
MPKIRRSPVGRACGVALAGTLLGTMLCACASDGGAGGSGAATMGTFGELFTGRPRVSMSVAESFPGSGVEQLDFFDALEKRDLVSYDDALHASLLLFAGQSGQTYVQRAGRAKQMGLLDEKFDRPPREAITVGELSLILAAGLHRPDTGSEYRAVEDLKGLGILPDFTDENTGVSGAQLLTILGHAEDAMAMGAAAPAHDQTVRPSNEAEKARASAGVFADHQPATRKPVKKPPIDLQDDAKKPRPGQVLPTGSPASESPATTPPPPPTPTPAPAPAQVPENAPAAKPTPSPTPTTAPAESMPAATKASSARKPLPPPHAEGGVPSRVDGVASDLRYVALDKVKAQATEVMGPGEFVQWRAVDDGRGRPGDWQTLQPGDPINDRMEIRTGLGARVSLKVGDSASVVVHRLSRLRLEEKIRSDGGSQLGVTIYRGMVEAAAPENEAAGQTGSAIFVRTPDQVFPLRTRALFEYDAFRGTIAREFRP